MIVPEIVEARFTKNHATLFLEIAIEIDMIV